MDSSIPTQRITGQTRHYIEGGAEGVSIVVTMLAGTLMIREDGTQGVPPWNE